MIRSLLRRLVWAFFIVCAPASAHEVTAPFPVELVGKKLDPERTKITLFYKTGRGISFCASFSALSTDIRGESIGLPTRAYRPDRVKCQLADENGMASFDVYVFEMRGVLISSVVTADDRVHSDVIHLRPPQ